MKAFLVSAAGSSALLGIVVLLGLGLINQYSQEDRQLASLTRSPTSDLSGAPDSSEAAQLPTRPQVYFAAITERPIFAPTRRPVQPSRDDMPVQPAEVTVPEPEEAEAPLTVQLRGIRGHGDKYSVLLSNDGQTPEWVEVGAAIGRWKVSEIGSDWIIMKNGENSQRLELYQ